MQAHNIWFYTSDWQRMYLFLTSNVSIAVLSAVSTKMVYIAHLTVAELHQDKGTLTSGRHSRHFIPWEQL